MTGDLREKVEALLLDCETTDDGRVSVSLATLLAVRTALTAGERAARGGSVGCTHGWRGTPPKDAPVIVTRCPACGGVGGWEDPNTGWMVCETCRGKAPEPAPPEAEPVLEGGA